MEQAVEQFESAAERIIFKFKGVSAMSRALGHKYPTTVQGWKTRKQIPADQQQHVLDAAGREGIALGPEDFFWRPNSSEAAA